MNTNRVWMLGSLLLAAVILVAGWFVGVSPLLAEAAAADQTRIDVEEQNRAQEGTLVALKQEYTELAGFQSELDGMRDQLPIEADIPDFMKELDAIQVASGAKITNLAASDAVPYLSISEEPVEEAPVDDGESAPTTDEEATTAAPAAADAVEAEPVAATAPAIEGAELVTGENFILIPISLASVGSLDQVMAFVGGLQKSARLFTVNDVVVEYDESKEAFTATVEGSIYVFTDAAPVAPAQDLEAATAGTVN